MCAVSLALCRTSSCTNMRESFSRLLERVIATHHTQQRVVAKRGASCLYAKTLTVVRAVQTQSRRRHRTLLSQHSGNVLYSHQRRSSRTLQSQHGAEGSYVVEATPMDVHTTLESDQLVSRIHIRHTLGTMIRHSRHVVGTSIIH